MTKNTNLTARVWCTVCGGTDVQHIDWIDPNSGSVVGDYFGDWYAMSNKGESFCNDCNDHTLLTDEVHLDNCTLRLETEREG